MVWDRGGPRRSRGGEILGSYRQLLQEMIRKKGLVRRWWAVQISTMLSQTFRACILTEALRNRRL